MRVTAPHDVGQLQSHFAPVTNKCFRAITAEAVQIFLFSHLRVKLSLVLCMTAARAEDEDFSWCGDEQCCASGCLE